MRRVRALIEQGDPWSRALALHLTASAVVVHPESRRVLLRWHARMQRWLQVGGHGDPGETDPWLIACREAQEETGLVDLAPLTPEATAQLVQIVIVPVPAADGDPAHEHADLRYVLATARPATAVPEAPGAALRWMTIAEAVADVGEENLRECLRRVERLLP